MFSVPDPDCEHSVHGQRDGRSATHRGESLDLARGVGPEMVAPHVEPRVEELRRGTGGRIDRDAPRTLPQGARDARERQVLESGHAPGGSRNDVIDAERRFLTGLRESAILAPNADS